MYKKFTPFFLLIAMTISGMEENKQLNNEINSTEVSEHEQDNEPIEILSCKILDNSIESVTFKDSKGNPMVFHNPNYMPTIPDFELRNK